VKFEWQLALLVVGVLIFSWQEDSFLLPQYNNIKMQAFHPGGIMQSDHKADCSLPACAKVKNVWNEAPPTSMFFMMEYLSTGTVLPYHK
jgi:hypothetical protein